MYACIHTNTYIYKYMNMYIYIYIYIHVNMFIYAYKLAYVCMYRYTYIKKSVCIYVDILAIHWICYVHSTSTQKYQTSWKYCLFVPSFIGSDSWGVRSVILPHVRYEVPTQNCINQKSALTGAHHVIHTRLHQHRSLALRRMWRVSFSIIYERRCSISPCSPVSFTSFTL